MVTVLIVDPRPKTTLPVVKCLILTSNLENCEAGDTDNFSFDWFEEETSSLLSQT